VSDRRGSTGLAGLTEFGLGAAGRAGLRGTAVIREGLDEGDSLDSRPGAELREMLAVGAAKQCSGNRAEDGFLAHSRQHNRGMTVHQPC
jgi:hypothetical protein